MLPEITAQPLHKNHWPSTQSKIPFSETCGYNLSSSCIDLWAPGLRNHFGQENHLKKTQPSCLEIFKDAVWVGGRTFLAQFLCPCYSLTLALLNAICTNQLFAQLFDFSSVAFPPKFFLLFHFYSIFARLVASSQHHRLQMELKCFALTCFLHSHAGIFLKPQTTPLGVCFLDLICNCLCKQNRRNVRISLAMDCKIQCRSFHSS